MSRAYDSAPQFPDGAFDHRLVILGIVFDRPPMPPRPDLTGKAPVEHFFAAWQSEYLGTIPGGRLARRGTRPVR